MTNIKPINPNNAEELERWLEDHGKTSPANLARLKAADTLCRQCIGRHEMLCSGVRPWFDVTQTINIPAIGRKMCHKKQGLMVLEELSQLLQMSGFGTAEIERAISTYPDNPFYEYRDGRVRLGNTEYPVTGVFDDKDRLRGVQAAMSLILQGSSVWNLPYPAAKVALEKNFEISKYGFEADLVIISGVEQIPPWGIGKDLLDGIEDRIHRRKVTWLRMPPKKNLAKIEKRVSDLLKGVENVF